VGEVRDEFVQRLFRVQLAPQAVQEIERRPRPRQMVAQHAEAEAFGGAGTSAPDEAPAARPEPARSAAPAAPVRALPRVGRNDPCPCGSGKKYKKCHMPADERVGSGS
jgi:preprotein translocase subunit SecA